MKKLLPTSISGSLPKPSWLAQPEIGALEVSAHCHSQGSQQGNLQLAADRAKTVVDALVAQGLPPEKLTATGLGQARPRDPEAPASTMDRVEFLRQSP